MATAIQARETAPQFNAHNIGYRVDGKFVRLDTVIKSILDKIEELATGAETPETAKATKGGGKSKEPEAPKEPETQSTENTDEANTGGGDDADAENTDK